MNPIVKLWSWIFLVGIGAIVQQWGSGNITWIQALGFYVGDLVLFVVGIVGHSYIQTCQTYSLRLIPRCFAQGWLIGLAGIAASLIIYGFYFLGGWAGLLTTIGVVGCVFITAWALEKA